MRLSLRSRLAVIAAALFALVIPVSLSNALAASQATPWRLLYQYDFVVAKPITSASEEPIRAREAVAFRELHRCFNCSFPVNGAPRSYPSEGQFIPLKACVAGVCRNAPVRAYSRESEKWFYFIAQRGHFDGEGSQITFSFSTHADGKLHLQVTARVTNPTIPDFLNKEGARYTWHNFATNLGTNLYYHQGCRFTC